MNKLLLFTFLVAAFSSAYAGECKNPKPTVNSFTTTDATIVSQVAFIGEFNLDCGGKEYDGNLFAEVEGRLTPVARVDGSYQVSWSEDIKKARSGDHLVRLFDDEGFASIRKAQKAGEKLSTVKSFADVAVNHYGTYKGPWVNSEIVAAFASVVVAYFAFTTKSKILS